ncbi:lactoylglutathione lyase [Neptunicella sp. SCSIO 80796]|uniref:lactoylglutathione lyase n=1 Tax=Neptunicella plasticusilytica TaxID=3117012 RepID=UPI003A4D4F48
MKVNEIRLFIPCKDYEQSKSFYKSLGFAGESAGDDLTIFEKDGCTFFLQKNFYSEEFSKNLMLQLIVEDINEAYEVVSNINDTDIKHSEIKQERWGQIVYLWGPSGELWHITELNS